MDNRPKPDPTGRVAELLVEARDLRRLAGMTKHPPVGRLLLFEAFDREEESAALARWLLEQERDGA